MTGLNNEMKGLIALALDELFEDDDMPDESAWSEEEDVIPILAALGILKPNQVPRVDNSAENLVEQYSDWDFKHHFHLNKTTFERLVHELQHDLEPHNVRGKAAISSEKQILAFLWYLANLDSIREIAKRFGISTSATHGILHKVSVAISSLNKIFITWPDHQNQEQIAIGFSESSGVENVIGVLDGSHIRLANVLDKDHDYINQKGFPSVTLQVLVDDRLLIRDAYVGWPGCSHDARVYCNSPLKAMMDTPGLFAKHKLVIGDAVHPNSKVLVTPFRSNGHMTPQRRYFNEKISSARQCAERALGLLKGRFRRLRCIYCHSAREICYYIMAACVLHNLAILCDDDIDDMIDDGGDNHPNNYPPFHRVNLAQAARREALVQELWDDRQFLT